MRFPVFLCIFGAAASFWAMAWLRRFKVRTNPPASRAHLSLEERQQKIRTASWIAFGMGCLYMAGAAVLAVLK
jgi:hypothetical protein